MDDAAGMNAMFENAMQGEKKDLNLTQEEAERFKKCFQDPEFRKLFADYADEISDPKHRAEQEQYISQLEGEQKLPEDKELIRPKAGFVIKSHKQNEKPVGASKEKMFINMVQSDKVAPPSSRRATGDKKGLQWTLPHCLGPVRMEQDKGGSNVPTFDCCFHPETLSMAERNGRFRELIAQVALEAVARGYELVGQKVKIDKDFKVLKGVSYKNGDPVTMMISKEKKEEWSKEPTTINKPPEPPKSASRAAAAAPTTTTTTTKTSLAASKQPKISEAPSTTPAKADGPIQPQYSITERGFIDMADHMMADAGGPKSTRPKELVIKIQLPLIKGASDLELDLAERRLILTSTALGGDASRKYALDVKLPYPVFDEKSAAKFDKQKKVLTITIPVKPPPPVAAPPSSSSSGAAVSEVDKAVETEEEGEVPVATPAPSSTKAGGDGHGRWVAKEEPHESRLVIDKDEVARAVEKAKEEAERRQADMKVEGGDNEEKEGRAKVEATPSDWSWFDDGAPFNPSKDFVGARPGYVFKKGPSGLGYYRDATAAPLPAPSSLSPPNGTDASAADGAVVAERPSFRFQQSQTSLSVIVQVKAIDQTSVKAIWGGESRKKVDIRFDAVEVSSGVKGGDNTSAAAASCRKSYRLRLNLQNEVDADRCKFDVADNNMLVVLYKSTPEMWLSLESEGDDVEEEESPQEPKRQEEDKTVKQKEEGSGGSLKESNVPATLPLIGSKQQPMHKQEQRASSDATLAQFRNKLLFELD